MRWKASYVNRGPDRPTVSLRMQTLYWFLVHFSCSFIVFCVFGFSVWIGQWMAGVVWVDNTFSAAVWWWCCKRWQWQLIKHSSTWGMASREAPDNDTTTQRDCRIRSSIFFFASLNILMGCTLGWLEKIKIVDANWFFCSAIRSPMFANSKIY